MTIRVGVITTDARDWIVDKEPNYPNFGTAIRALLEGFERFPGAIEVHVISCGKVDYESPKKLAPNLFFHRPIVRRIGWGRTLYSGCILDTRKIVQRLGIDLVHGQGTEGDCALSAVHSGLPNVVTIHGNMAELHRLGYHGHKLFSTLASVLESHALRRTGGVFCNSAYTESLVAPRAKRTWLVPNAIRSGFFEPSTGVPDGDIPHILNVGLVNPRKRQLEILKSIRHLHRSGHAMKILFAGGLSEDTEYGRAFVEELMAAEKEGVAGYVGFLDQRQLVELMDRCSGFIHFPTEEAFGLVVAEALARGLKFFGADLGGIRDIAKGVPGAELYTSFPDLQAGVAAWLQHGAPVFPNAAARMEALYSPNTVALRHIQIYREFLKR
jgi:glycosyltransferase involved in cell wall biosynthesis